jgi:hypothetical protein
MRTMKIGQSPVCPMKSHGVFEIPEKDFRMNIANIPFIEGTLVEDLGENPLNDDLFYSSTSLG